MKTFSKQVYPKSIVIVGMLALLVSCYFLRPIPQQDLYIISLLVCLIWICEHYYIPVNSYGFSLVLPLLFWITIHWGLALSVVVVGVVTLFDGLISNRWKTRISLYPFHIMIALIGTTGITHLLKQNLLLHLNSPHVFLTWSLWFTFFFFLLKNFLEFLHKGYIKKDRIELFWNGVIFILSTIYCWLTLCVSIQDRGQIDMLSYFFFYSPLVGSSLIASFITGLQREKYRLGHLFKLTMLVNSGITDKDPINKVVGELQRILPVDASILWLNENNQWDVFHRKGAVQNNLEITDRLKEAFLKLYDIYESKDLELAKPFFKRSIHTFIFAPLRVEGDLVGVWAIGSKQTTMYNKSDFQTFVTLANYVAAVAKTRRLVREKQQVKIFEERNRIAREIHDGIGQTIAGAVMHLQSLDKLIETDLEGAKELVNKSLDKLRTSLSQVRTSIYELRPHPSDSLGLLQAIKDRIRLFQEEFPEIQVRLLLRGSEVSQNVAIENEIFGVLKESLKNIEKHAEATIVTIIVAYLKESFCFIIRDNGVGFTLGETLFRAKSHPHFGLLNMNERAEQLGGTLEIKTRKNKGTKIKLKMPYIDKKEVDQNG